MSLLSGILLSACPGLHVHFCPLHQHALRGTLHATGEANLPVQGTARPEKPGAAGKAAADDQ